MKIDRFLTFPQFSTTQYTTADRTAATASERRRFWQNCGQNHENPKKNRRFIHLTAGVIQTVMWKSFQRLVENQVENWLLNGENRLCGWVFHSFHRVFNSVERKTLPLRSV